jgi:hypothetical protein
VPCPVMPTRLRRFMSETAHGPIAINIHFINNISNDSLICLSSAAGGGGIDCTSPYIIPKRPRPRHQCDARRCRHAWHRCIADVYFCNVRDRCLQSFFQRPRMHQCETRRQRPGMVGLDTECGPIAL